jgi:regulator of protease activity HflC (stomatin/prohibitin superfamily)
MGMGHMDDLLKGSSKSKFRWKRFLIILAVGIVPTTICFLFDWWWAATVFLLLTLFGLCFCFRPRRYPLVLSLYVLFAIAWISGSWLDGQLPIDVQGRTLGRTAAPIVAGLALSFGLIAFFWLIALYASTKWVLSVTESFDVRAWDAFKLVFSQTFDIAQNYVIVENGQIGGEKPRGVFSKLGGPGVLVVRPGNAVVLELGGRTTRIVGPGLHRLKRFEIIKRPREAKGILDLSPQFAVGTAENVLTRDGIPLTITVGIPYQIEPKRVTDQRPESHISGGEATTELIDGDYAVYTGTIRKAVFNTPSAGWQALFPAGPITILRDVVATYTLDEIFALKGTGPPDPDKRTIRHIEDQVKDRFKTEWAGILFGGLDIRGIEMPDEIEQQLHQRWLAGVARQLRIAEAEAEGRAIEAISDARTRALNERELVKYGILRKLAENLESLLNVLSDRDSEIAISFISVIQQLTSRIGQDESVAMRYIDAMQAIVRSEGPKSFVITPPTPSPGYLPSAPPPMPGQEGEKGKEAK